jgi:hypothetical protein
MRLPKGDHAKSNTAHTSLSQNRETKARAKDTAKITTRGKRSEWSAFGKACCAATASRHRRKIRF